MSAWPCVVVQWMQSLTVDFGLLSSFAAENPPLDVRSVSRSYVSFACQNIVRC